MSSERRDMTIETALSDPLIRAVMRADHVQPREFETFLRSAARKLNQSDAFTPRMSQNAFLVRSHGAAVSHSRCC